VIVLDTHIWVWWVNDSPQLIDRHKQWIRDYQAQGLGISVISCWEVAKLVEKNRLVLSIPVEKWLQTALAYRGRLSRTYGDNKILYFVGWVRRGDTFDDKLITFAPRCNPPKDYL
jgi:hypothetical protein